MSKYTNSVGSKLDWRQKQIWDYLCEYRGLKSAEYMRKLVMDEIDKHMKDREFTKYIKKRDQKG